MKKIYEFLLWNNCGNNCTFCHQRSRERKNLDKILTPEQQVVSLKKCQEFLKTTFKPDNHILLCGGELFDVKHPDVIQALKSLLEQVHQQILDSEIELLYLNTNLLYEDISLLTWFLDKIKESNLFPRLKFTTSYDIVGRYCNTKSEHLFYKNLKYLTDTYPDIKVVVNTVLTKEACERIKKDTFGADFLLSYLKEQGKETFTIKDWIEYFKVKINIIPNIILDYDKAPEVASKNDIFSTLLHVDTVIPGYLKDYAINIALTQEKWLYEYNKFTEDFDFCSSKIGDCGHSVNFKRSFSDSDDCFPCEITRLAKLKYEI